MCELYVCTESKVNWNSQYLDALCYKAGDVVAIVEDDWKWGSAELHNGSAKIIKAPKVSIADMEFLLLPEQGDRKVDPMLQRRAFALDIAAYDTLGTATLDMQAAISLSLSKSPLVDSDVFSPVP